MVRSTCCHMIQEFGDCMGHPEAAEFEEASIDAEDGQPTCCFSFPQDTTAIQ